MIAAYVVNYVVAYITRLHSNLSVYFKICLICRGVRYSLDVLVIFRSSTSRSITNVFDANIWFLFWWLCNNVSLLYYEIAMIYCNTWPLMTGTLMISLWFFCVIAAWSIWCSPQVDYAYRQAYWTGLQATIWQYENFQFYFQR